MNSENAIIGQKIRTVREKQKLSREKLAELSNISTQFLADIETGKKGMTVVTLKKICTALHISADSVIFETTNNDTSVINAMLSTVPKEKYEDMEQIINMIIKLI